MTDTSNIQHWSYPFKTRTSSSSTQNDADIYYTALSKAQDGFYPMGAGGLWHGGVHFDENTVSLLDQSAISCIADGEVIAYRIDDEYPQVVYGTSGKEAKFSTGFVLVKHRLEFPATPTSTTSLTFYSLYTHLLNWNSYRTNPTLSVPDFIGEKTYQVSDSATDSVLGLRVRSAASAGTTPVLALLPKGCKVRLGAAAPGDTKWRKLESVIEGNAIPALGTTDTGWVYVLELDAVPGDAALFHVGDKAKDKEHEMTSAYNGLNVRKTGNTSGMVTAVLPRGAKLKIGSKCTLSENFYKIERVLECNGVPAPQPDSTGAIPGWIYLPSLTAIPAAPQVLDTIHELDPPYSIKAGGLIGHLGQYQRYDDAAAKDLLHLEVFSCDDVPAFIESTSHISSGFEAKEKTLLKIEKNTTLAQPNDADTQVPNGCDVKICTDSPKDGRWVKVQKYIILIVNKSLLGTYNSSGKTYQINETQKTALATQAGVSTSQIPAKAEFLGIFYGETDDITTSQQSEVSANPSLYPRRKIGLSTTDTMWVERSQLTAEGKRRTIEGNLPAWNAFPLTGAIKSGGTSAYEAIFPLSTWNTLTLEKKAQDQDKTQWWLVTLCDASGASLSGWICENDPQITRHSPWEWPGFDIVNETASPSDHLARSLDAADGLTTSESTNYGVQVNRADGGELLQALYSIIDTADSSGSKDGKLTPTELKNALEITPISQKLSHLISHYESEWYADESLSKWNELDSLMGDALEDWNTEKDRIRKLVWWKELAGKHGISSNGQAYHFHPVGLIGNFLTQTNCCALNLEKFHSIFGNREIFNAYNMPTSGNAYKVSHEKFVELLNSEFDRNDFSKCIYKSHFLAQCFHESDHFRTTVEYASGNDYDLSLHPASDCVTYGENSQKCKRHHQIINEGNNAIGDGPKYKGRGLIQITWKSAYSAYKSYSGIDCVAHPELICESIENAIAVSFWFWTKFKTENLNAKIDRYYTELSAQPDLIEEEIDKEVVRRITKVVNGGDNHLAERQALFKKIKGLLK